MGRVLLALLVLAVGTPCQAADLPVFDVRVHCATRGEAERTSPAACRKSEQAARAAIEARWAAYPTQRKHFCVESVRFLRKEQRSYVTLAECLKDPETLS